MRALKPNDTGAPAAAATDVDKLIHEPARLGLVAQLYVLQEADCLFLVNQTGLTWGNLGSHLGKLEQAGYVEVTKQFVARKPRTTVRLTAEGRAAFERYREMMTRLLDQTPMAAGRAGTPQS